MSFHPEEPKTLVSCAMHNSDGAWGDEPAIIFWNLDGQRQRALELEAPIEALGKKAVDGVVAGLYDARSAWTLTEHEKETLAQDVEKAITTLNIKSQVQQNLQINRRLIGNFGNQIFNTKGTSMVFCPGSRPNPNAVDKWDVCIWDATKKEVSLTLEGHTDAIMWAGFSPDDKLIGSVSWNKTFRIWSHANGNLLHTFKSNHQNWTGGFSPDSCFFAGTSGEGYF